jgi:hypothetical protein
MRTVSMLAVFAALSASAVVPVIAQSASECEAFGGGCDTVKNTPPAPPAAVGQATKGCLFLHSGQEVCFNQLFPPPPPPPPPVAATKDD